MLTKKLRQAYVETEKLVKFLEKREWDNSKELCTILERADQKIDQIVERAISDILVKLQGSYSEEAKAWIENKMTDFNRNPIKITKAERQKVKTQLKRINKTIENLYEIL